METKNPPYFLIHVGLLLFPKLSTCEPWRWPCEPARISFYKDTHYRGYSITVEKNDTSCYNLHRQIATIKSVSVRGNCIIAWRGSDCIGRSVRIAPGTPHHENLARLGLGSLYDLSSFNLCSKNDSGEDQRPCPTTTPPPPIGSKITFYEWANYKGASITVERFNSSSCHNFWRDWTGRASSVNTRDRCIIAWDNQDCAGRSERLDSKTLYQSDLSRIDFDDKISSFNLCSDEDELRPTHPPPTNATGITFYKDSNWRGDSITVMLYDHSTCYNFFKEWDDSISSVNTYDKCILAWAEWGCAGRGRQIAPGTPHHNFLTGILFNDVISSFNLCPKDDGHRPPSSPPEPPPPYATFSPRLPPEVKKGDMKTSRKTIVTIIVVISVIAICLVGCGCVILGLQRRRHMLAASATPARAASQFYSEPVVPTSSAYYFSNDVSSLSSSDWDSSSSSYSYY